MVSYKTEIQSFNTSFNMKANCNVITFINNGGSAVYVNNYPLAGSGGTLQIAGNAGEIDVTEYRVNMGTISGDVWVIRKVDQFK